MFVLIMSPLPNFMFCGLSLKEKQARMESVSFSYLIFSLLNNLIWLAYAEKVNDRNIGIPSFVGKPFEQTVFALSEHAPSNAALICYGWADLRNDDKSL